MVGHEGHVVGNERPGRLAIRDMWLAMRDMVGNEGHVVGNKRHGWQ